MLIDDLLCRFEEVWLHDFEFVPEPGERPDVVCLAARELRSGRTLRLWRDQLSSTPPYRTDDGVLFVNFVANAELTCHLALGWPVPRYTLDLSPVFRNLTNGLYTPEGKGLLGALTYYGISNIGSKKKDSMQKRIIAGWPFTPEERERIPAYCMSDVDALQLLLPRILAEPDFDLAVALFHGESVAALARMQHNGVPIDMPTFTKLTDKETWRAIRDSMVPIIDAQYGVYVRQPNGDWSFDMELFSGYLAREGILPGWPRTETGKLSTKRKVFEEMAKGWPQLEELRQLRHARDKMRKIKLEVGGDGRNRTVLWPFVAKTSRTQPKASRWIFSPAVWLRSLIKPEPGMALAYIDYSSMEFLLAASLSDGHIGPVNTMLDMYRSGDPYRAFAVQVGAIPEEITTAMLKNPEQYVTPNLTLGQLKEYASIRERYKVMLLAVQYGMQGETLAGRLGVSTFEAQEMLQQHRAQFAAYWAWSDDFMQQALQAGRMWTAFGWCRRTGIVEFNERSIRNWPVQTAGADILRIACILGTRHGIRILAPVHDAVLIEASIETIEADVALMQEIMRRASRIVLNATAEGTHELRTDAKIIRYPERYSDKRGEAIWGRVMQLLAAYTASKMAA
jgi:hypothetical protein